MSEIIAHRGASFDAPENTLESFQLGLEQGADAIECDVRLSRDGELVVIHDPTVERVAKVTRAVADLSVAELQALEVGGWKAAKWNGARIPTLPAVLDLVPAGRRIFIEVKVGQAALPRLKELLAETALSRSQIVMMEFDLETVIAMRSLFPDIEVLWLNDFPRVSPPWKKRRALQDNIKTAKRHGFDGINVQNIAPLDAEAIAECGAQGLLCYCWTVDQPGRAARLLKGGIGGIATNRPGWMREQLGGLVS
ncbi:glycerophosphodiester phosphodiesterase [Pontiellaceae bacterium B1224]|nr:glycerophosphodiester phosphodiesterase [Pontiellaceae bacterium B1224]